ncbi:MAG: hypothetical protein K6G79_04230, partial [Bacteroidales bacterium]|nr:hypothetical protein [Bacteroidales bacterium]
IVARRDPGYLCKKVTGMLTREQILEIDAFCAEHGVSCQSRLDELQIPRHQYFRWKRKYREEDECGPSQEGSFVQISPGGPFMSPMMPPERTRGRAKGKDGTAEQSFLTIELRTASGTAMRIQGNMTAAHLREIISAG